MKAPVSGDTVRAGASAWTDEQDRLLFADAVRILKEHVDLGRRWPLYYTLPTGRSIESLSDRIVHLPGKIPDDLIPPLRQLMAALSLVPPGANTYREWGPALRAIADHMALL